MQILPVPAELETPATTVAARRLIQTVNDEITGRVARYQTNHWAFWGRFDELTPDEVLVAMGNAALPWLLFVRAERASFEAFAALAGTNLVGLIGEPFTDPPRAFQIDPQTGAVTLGPPADGHDAWGRLIPTE